MGFVGDFMGISVIHLCFNGIYMLVISWGAMCLFFFAFLPCKLTIAHKVFVFLEAMSIGFSWYISRFVCDVD